MSKTQEKNKITIDDLGGMIARGFDRVDKRIDTLENKLENKIDGLETRIDGLEFKMDNGFNSLQNQLDSARLDYTPRREHSLLVGRVKRVQRKVGISPTQ